jgi:hypothetical protein
VTDVAVGLKTLPSRNGTLQITTPSVASSCEYLTDFVAERPKLIGSQVHTALTELLRALKTPPEKRRFENPT